MSDEPKKTAGQPEGTELEYVFDKVPDSARKSIGSILVILTGYTSPCPVL